MRLLPLQGECSHAFKSEDWLAYHSIGSYSSSPGHSENYFDIPPFEADRRLWPYGTWWRHSKLVGCQFAKNIIKTKTRSFEGTHHMTSWLEVHRATQRVHGIHWNPTAFRLPSLMVNGPPVEVHGTPSSSQIRLFTPCVSSKHSAGIFDHQYTILQM